MLKKQTKILFNENMIQILFYFSFTKKVLTKCLFQDKSLWIYTFINTDRVNAHIFIQKLY